MSDTAAVLAWRGDLAHACGVRLHSVGDELLRLVTRVQSGVAQPWSRQTWRGLAARDAAVVAARRVGMVRRLAAELTAAARGVLETGHRIRVLHAALGTSLARARGEPFLEHGPSGSVSARVRLLEALALLSLGGAGGAGGAELARLELMVRQLDQDVHDCVDEALRLDRRCASGLAALALVARSLLRSGEPKLLRADHVRLLGAVGMASWLRTVPSVGTPPQDVADWWAAHRPEERSALLGEVGSGDPALAIGLGSLDGLPFDVRDVVNRVALGRRCAGYAARIAALDTRLSGSEGRSAALLVREIATLVAARSVDLAVRTQLQALDAARDQVSGQRLRCLLLVDDPEAWGGIGRVSVSVGPVDQAEHVAVLVPGLGVSPGTGLADLAGSAKRIYDRARALAPGRSVAVVAWLGYRTPGWAQVGFDARARRGSVRLARDLEGIRVARAARPPHLTLIGHSYGSTTAALALRGTLARLDDAVFLGSPGLLAEHASDLPVRRGHVWVGASSADEVSHLSRFGVDPAARSFGAHRFPAEFPPGTPLVAQHTHYLAEGTESLDSVARIVVGAGGQVRVAPGRVDSGLAGELERLAASGAGLPILPELLGPAPGDLTFADPAR